MPRVYPNFAERGRQVACAVSDADVRAIAAKGDDGRIAMPSDAWVPLKAVGCDLASDVFGCALLFTEIAWIDVESLEEKM